MTHRALIYTAAMCLSASAVCAHPPIGAVMQRSPLSLNQSLDCRALVFDEIGGYFRCATGIEVGQVKCVSTGSIAAGVLSGAITVTWNTAFTLAADYEPVCDIKRGEPIGVQKWRTVSPHTAVAVDVVVWNRDANNARSGTICCTAEPTQ